MADWLTTILLGILEGITEFLPISSTGHLLLAERWMGVHRSDLFNVVIQAGAVLAVIPLFSKRILATLSFWKDPLAQDYTLKLAVAFLVTAVGGLALEKAGFKLEDRPVPVAIALLVGGVLFIVIEKRLEGRIPSDHIGWNAALLVGAGQLVAAIFPGASRSGTTILVCLLLGLSRPAATEFSFLVGIPTMLAASGLKIFKALLHSPGQAPAEDWNAVILGFLVAAVVSFIAVKWLLGYIRHHTFTVFGWYRITLGLIILLVAAQGAR